MPRVASEQLIAALDETAWIMKRTTCFAMLVLFAAAANAAPFTAGNLAVLQVGDGSAVLGNGSTALFIDEFSTLGSLVQTLSLIHI